MKSFQNQKVLVAGATGFIGSHVMERLLEEGALVRAVGFKRSVLHRDSHLETISADLTIRENCRRAVQGMDVVFLCAASTAGAAVMTSTPLAQVTPNILMNSQLLEEAYRAGVKKFIFISSSAAYPPSDDRPVKEEEMFEGDPFDVYFAVGWMKRYSEILCKMYAEKLNPRMSCVVVRPSNVYGPGDKFDPKTSHMMASLIRRTAERENPFVVWGSGQEVRDLIYIDDFIDGLMLAAKQLDCFEPINIASGKGYSIKELISTLLRAEEFPADVRFDATKPTVAPIRLIDTSMAARLLGFKTATSLEEGVRRTLAWYKENKLEVSS